VDKPLTIHQILAQNMLVKSKLPYRDIAISCKALGVIMSGENLCWWPTCNFVPDEFTALDFANGGEEGADLLLRHRLRQVVDDQVCLGLLLAAARVGLRRRVVRVRRRVGRAVVQAAILCGNSVQAVLHHGCGGGNTVAVPNLQSRMQIPVELEKFRYLFV
jgi:hypothetical protein